MKTCKRDRNEPRHLVSYKSRVDDEAAAGAPERFTFGNAADSAQAFGYDAAGGELMLTRCIV